MNKIIIILTIILLIGGIFIITGHGYNLAKKSDSNEFVKSFSGWVVRVATNSVNLVGNAIKMDWIPK